MNFYISVVLMSSRDAFLDFQRLSRKSKKLKISMTATCEKIAIFANFSVLHILPPNEWIFTFQLSWCQVGMLSLIFKGFPENQKIEDFDDRGPAKKLQFLLISVFCIFCPQMSEFYISVVLMSSRDAFLDFQRLPENQKNWRFRWPRTCEKIANFC